MRRRRRKAVERFDPAKGGKLSTYGAWWIKQSIKRALANQSKTIRLPIHLIDKIYKLYRASLTMSEELGREPTDEELSEEIGISSTKLSQLKTVSIGPASLLKRLEIKANGPRSLDYFGAAVQNGVSRDPASASAACSRVENGLD